MMPVTFSKNTSKKPAVRMNHFAGLPSEALMFLTGLEVKSTVCPSCGHVQSRENLKTETFMGLFGEKYPL